MGRSYYDDVFDSAIKHAGRELLLDMAGVALPSEEPRYSERFEKSMKCIVDGEIRKRRVSKIIKVTTRVAAALLILLFVSTAVVFSSEALRSEVFNMFSKIGEGSVDIGPEVDSGSIPVGMIVPGYIPEGFRLANAKEIGISRFKSEYKDLSGNIISIKQLIADNLDLGIDNDGRAYETEISGVKVIAADNDDNNIVAFIYREYAYTIRTLYDVELSELLKMAQSIIER